MPKPKPSAGETYNDFIDRCMSNSNMEDDYSETDERYDACNILWNRKETSDMNKKIYETFTIEVKSVDEEKRVVEAIVSQQKKDRDGDIITIDGIDFKHYKKNPVLLWAHNHYDPPIGKAISIKKDGKNLKAKFEYASAEEYPFADTIYRLTKGGYINAYSIGFAPDFKESVWDEKNGGYVFNKCELFEVSAVPVPSNPYALVESKDIQKALTDKVINKEELDEFQTFIDGLVGEKDIEKETTDEELLEQKDIKVKCNTCGHELVCPECSDKSKEADNDPYDWLFKDLEISESKQESIDQDTELLNSLGIEV